AVAIICTESSLRDRRVSIAGCPIDRLVPEHDVEIAIPKPDQLQPLRFFLLFIALPSYRRVLSLAMKNLSACKLVRIFSIVILNPQRDLRRPQRHRLTQKGDTRQLSVVTWKSPRVARITDWTREFELQMLLAKFESQIGVAN